MLIKLLFLLNAIDLYSFQKLDIMYAFMAFILFFVRSLLSSYLKICSIFLTICKQKAHSDLKPTVFENFKIKVERSKMESNRNNRIYIA